MAGAGLVAVPGATSAHAAPAFHCDASALRATIAGTQPLEPVTQGRSGDCAAGEATPAVALPSLLLASALIARTDVDAGTGAATATGGIGDLRVLLTPELIAQLPTEQFINSLPAQTVTVPMPLAATMALLGLPTTLQLDVRDAVRTLVPAPGAALLSADLLAAHANISCQRGLPSLSGSTEIAGVRLLGQDVGVDTVLSQALTVLGGGSIEPARLDVTKVHVITPLVGITGPVLAQLQTALVPLVAALPPITLPASVLDVELTPHEQVADAGSLTQRALRASISLLGQPVLDAVLGEAHVAAADGACALPVPTPAPAAKTTKAVPATRASGAQGSVADQMLACTDRKLVLVDVLQRNGRVRLLGAADRRYAGKQVAIRLRATGKVVAHAVVHKDGSFATAAPLPARAFLATHRRANRVRYRAEIGKELSLPLKLRRRLIVSRLTSKAGTVTVAGRVTGPLTTPVSTIRLVRRVSCHKVVLVTRFTPHADGTFRVTVKAPKGQAAAVYRMVTRVREKPSNPRTYPTFTLPRGVALDTR